MTLLSLKKRKPKPHAPGAGPGSHVAPGGGHYEEGEHPRGPGGRFADKPGEEKPKPKPAGAEQPKKPPKRGRRIEAGKPEPAKHPLATSMLDFLSDDQSYRPGGAAAYRTIRQSGKDWAEGKEQHKDINDAWQSIYDETQARLKAQGIPGIVCYRGVRVPPDHPLSKAVKAGKLKAGDEVELDGTVMTSWSGHKKIAKRFVNLRGAENEDHIGFVFKVNAPAKEIVTSHLTHDSLKVHEAEHVLKNTGKVKAVISVIKRSAAQEAADKIEAGLKR